MEKVKPIAEKWAKTGAAWTIFWRSLVGNGHFLGATMGEFKRETGFRVGLCSPNSIWWFRFIPLTIDMCTIYRS